MIGQDFVFILSFFFSQNSACIKGEGMEVKEGVGACVCGLPVQSETTYNKTDGIFYFLALQIVAYTRMNLFNLSISQLSFLLPSLSTIQSIS